MTCRHEQDARGGPVLVTARLRLPQLADFDHWAAFFASDRSHLERGPLDRVAAWQSWAADVGLWQLKGNGAFGLDDRATGAYVGEVGIYEPEGFPEPELGWFTVPEAEGKGYAFEAVRAVIGWAKDRFGWPRLVSIIDHANTCSLALGLRLGGIIDPSLPGVDPGDVVIRHDLRGRK